ncbi:unnamed protein product [Dracunculus medinensis]|uniref:NHR domain-containing protein n=1 Tax=Dracunculus medinensis TaxID=318479 RepID=A0A0N4U8N3_DRAME|nr:unnamed protein product [Dracunculus medinensis]
MACTAHWKLQEEGRYLRFHQNHSENISLLDDRRSALRRESFEKGLVFSERPLLPYEPFFVAIERIEGGWNGHLRLGLSHLDPNEQSLLQFREYNSKCVISLLFGFWRNPANAWMVAILASSIPCIRQISDNFQASTHLSMLFPLDSPPSSYPPMFLPTDVGSVIGVYYEPVDFHQARLHILLNNNDLEPKVFVPLDVPLYAVVDVYGITKQVRVVPVIRTVPRLSDLCERLIHKLIISEAAPVHTSRLPDRFRAIFQSKNSEIINAAQAISMSALRPI